MDAGIRRAEHLWQIGIGSHQDPTFDVLAIPVTCPQLETVLDHLRGAADRLLLLPSHWFHITLDASDSPRRWAPVKPFASGCVRLSAPVCSPHGLRLSVESLASISAIAESFGAPTRRYHLTIAYALRDLSGVDGRLLVEALSRALPEQPLEAAVAGVEHRRSVPGRPFTWSQIGHWSASQGDEVG